MKKQTKRYQYVLYACFVIIACLVIVLFLFNNKKNSKYKSKNEASSNEVASTETSSDEIQLTKETSGGFYLYDKEKQPIMNKQPIEIGTDETLEFNIECVNTCEVELNYSLAILVNDCYQEVSYEGMSNSFQGNGTIQEGSSEMINAKFELRSYNRDGKNELRIIMFYYPEEVPEDALDQVMVGDSVGIYPIMGSIADKAKFDNRLPNMKSHTLSAEQDTQAVWITEKESDTIPKFDYILDVKSQKAIYFNALGGQKSYRGMIFVDGVPIKVNKSCVFGWEQEENSLLSYKIVGELVDGNTMFAYMYAKGADLEESYITNLYKLSD